MEFTDAEQQPSLLSKGFEYATFATEKFEYDDYITKQSVVLSSELHINEYEVLLILNFVPEIMQQYRNLPQSKFIPTPQPVTSSSSLQSAPFFHYYQDYNAEWERVRFGIRLPNIYIQKFRANFEKFLMKDLGFNHMERNYQSLTFLVNYVNSFLPTYPSLAVN